MNLLNVNSVVNGFVLTTMCSIQYG